MMQKYFTVEEANRTLIFIKPIVKDIIEKRKIMISFKKEIRDIQLADDKNIFAEKVKDISKKLKII